MIRFWVGLLAGMFASLSAAADEVSVARYVSQMSQQEHFEVVGMDLIGADTFSLPKKQLPPDRRLGRALAGYNYIINYAGEHISKVIILGRKGDSVGDMPDSAPPPIDIPEPEAQLPEAVSE